MVTSRASASGLITDSRSRQPSVLDLAEPVLRSADDVGKDDLRNAATASIPRDPFANCEVVRHAPHSLTLCGPRSREPD